MARVAALVLYSVLCCADVVAQSGMNTWNDGFDNSPSFDIYGLLSNLYTWGLLAIFFFVSPIFAMYVIAGFSGVLALVGVGNAFAEIVVCALFGAAAAILHIEKLKRGKGVTLSPPSRR